MSTPLSTSHYIYRAGTAPNTRAAVSQKNKIYGYAVGIQGFQQIGVLSEFSHSESRSAEPIRGIGYGDQVAELIPGVTDPMTISLNKSLLYVTNLFQVVGYRGGVSGLVRSLKHHRWPFDIRQELVFSEISSGAGTGIGDLTDAGTAVKDAVFQGNSSGSPAQNAKALFTFFEGCWLTSYSANYASDSAIVAETGEAMVSDVIDGFSQYGEWMQTGLSPAGAGDAMHSMRFGAGSSAGQGSHT